MIFVKTLKECLNQYPWRITFTELQIKEYHCFLKKKIEKGIFSENEMLLYCFLSFLNKSMLDLDNVKYLKQKEQENNIPFIFLLSKFHIKGFCIYEKNETLAFQYLKFCACHSFYDAYFPLAICFFNGEGTTQDLTAAYKTLKMTNPSDKRSFFLSVIRLFTSKNENDASREIFQLTCFGKRGFQDAYYYIGYFYRSKGKRKFLDFYLEGCAINSKKCFREMGYYYLKKKGKENRASSLAYFMNCIEYDDCLFLSGLLLFNFETANKEIHTKILKKSSDKGNAFSAFLLGCLTYHTDKESAKELLLNLAEYGTEASYALSKIYEIEGRKELSTYFLRRSLKELDGKDMLSLIEYYKKEYPFSDLFKTALNKALMLK